MITYGVVTAAKPVATSTRKLTFLLKERWKAIQKARRKGMSLRAIERELGIHRATIKKYMDQEIHGRCGSTNTATLGEPRDAITDTMAS